MCPMIELLRPTEYVITIGDHTYKLTRRRGAALKGTDEWTLLRCKTDDGWHTLHIEQYTIDGVWVFCVLPNSAHPAPQSPLTFAQALAILNKLRA